MFLLFCIILKDLQDLVPIFSHFRTLSTTKTHLCQVPPDKLHISDMTESQLLWHPCPKCRELLGKMC